MTDDQTSTVVGWVPAFEGQRPPFTADHPAIAQPGNMRGLHHGYHSERVLAPIAKQLLDEVTAVPANGYLQEPQWRPALVAWARAEAQVLVLVAYLERAAAALVDGDGAPADVGVGDLGEDRVRTAYLLLHRAEARALSGRTRLGLDPLSRARLRKDQTSAALDAAAVFAELERREQAAAAEGGTS